MNDILLKFFIAWVPVKTKKSSSMYAGGVSADTRMNKVKSDSRSGSAVSADRFGKVS